MKRMVLFLISLLIVVLGTAILATADVPFLLNYQGKLTGPDGDYQMMFKIYDAEEDGNMVWQETHPVVTVTDGYFNVQLGSVVPITDVVFNGPDRWLGITIDADPELAPRTRLVTVPYAFRISTVDGSSGGTITSDVVIEGGLGQTALEVQGDALVTDRLDVGAVAQLGTNKVSIMDNDVCTNCGGIGLHYNGGIGGTFTLSNGTPYIMAGEGKKLHITTLNGNGDAIIIDNRNVGIGTTTPAAKFHDNGSIYTVGGNGDANLSGGQGDMSDLTLILNYLNQNSYLTEAGYAEADLDGDGKVTFDDLAILTQMLFQAETKEQAWRTIHSSYGVGPESGGDVFYVRGKAGIGTSHPQGALDVTSTTGGFIVPRITTTERDAMTPVNGMIIYNTTNNQFNFYENGAWFTR